MDQCPAIVARMTTTELLQRLVSFDTTRRDPNLALTGLTRGDPDGSAGRPTIICGPGQLSQAHQPDEWIAETKQEAGDRFIRWRAARLPV